MERSFPLSSVTTFRIGGPAHFYQIVQSIEEMQKSLEFCQRENLPYFILGNGSNCLFDDKGFPGIVLHNRIRFFSLSEEGLLNVGAGYSFSLLGSQTARQGWSGLEFASGIPGTVGGAIYMNAGANGTETIDTLVSVEYLTEKGEILTLPRDALTFGYRTSPFQSLPGIILGATFQLSRSPTSRERQMEIIRYRTSTQPYDIPSAGCIFRNPLPQKAGALIEAIGWKGKRVGNAEISTKHANFIVNRGGARAADVQELIASIQHEIKTTYSLDLHVEIKQILLSEITTKSPL